MVRAVRTDAVLLRSVDYGEADRVLTFLTRALGRVSVMARGARSSRRRFGGALEPFSLLSIEFVRGRGDLGRLQQARILRAYPALLASLSRMRTCGGALELARGLLPDAQADDDAFATVEALLELGASVAEPLLPQLAVGFRLRLLSVAGFAPELARCGRCGRTPREGQAAEFDPEHRHLVCRACGGARLRLSARSRSLMDALRGPGWGEAIALSWPEGQQHEVEATAAALLAAVTR